MPLPARSDGPDDRFGLLRKERLLLPATESVEHALRQEEYSPPDSDMRKLAALNKALKSKHKLVIDGGYGKLKGQTFRISNMGDETDETIAALLTAIDTELAVLGVK